VTGGSDMGRHGFVVRGGSRRIAAAGAVAAVGAGVVLAVGGIPSAAAADGQCTSGAPTLGQIFGCVVGTDTVAVPAGAATLTLDVRGAGGGTGRFDMHTGAGGAGAELQGVATVPAGTVSLFVQVGAGGAAATDPHGGGSGGGGTGIFAVDADGHRTPLVIAGGGGGAGGGDVFDGDNAGDGGNAGTVGVFRGADGIHGGDLGPEDPQGAGRAGLGAAGANPGAAGEVVDGSRDLTVTAAPTAGEAPGDGVAAGGTGEIDDPGRHLGASGGGGYAGGGGSSAYGQDHDGSIGVGGGGGGSSYVDPTHAAAVTISSAGDRRIGTDQSGADGFVELHFDAAAPTAVAVDPGSVPRLGDTALTVHGTGFVPGGTTVTLGGNPCTDVTVADDTTLTCTAPAGAVGDANLVVTTQGGATAALVVHYTAQTPGAPTGLVAVPGDQRVTLTFTPPTDAGDSAISGYEYSADGGSTWHALAPITDDADGTVSGTVTGLTNGTATTFAVRALNDTGGGRTSTASAAVTPGSVTASPTPTGTTGSRIGTTPGSSSPGSTGATSTVGTTTTSVAPTSAAPTSAAPTSAAPTSAAVVASGGTVTSDTSVPSEIPATTGTPAGTTAVVGDSSSAGVVPVGVSAAGTVADPIGPAQPVSYDDPAAPTPAAGEPALAETGVPATTLVPAAVAALALGGGLLLLVRRRSARRH
jgi:hypothetical protein